MPTHPASFFCLGIAVAQAQQTVPALIGLQKAAH